MRNISNNQLILIRDIASMELDKGRSNKKIKRTVKMLTGFKIKKKDIGRIVNIGNDLTDIEFIKKNINTY